MAGRRGAFSFVDRITAFEPRARARGTFAVPQGLAAWSPCLVAEAVGQLAAWVAMEHVGFRSRPVAALAGEARMLADVAPGSTLNLEIEIDDCDSHAVTYDGWARVNGVVIMELRRAVGPMLAMEDFDDPHTMMDRFAALLDADAEPFDAQLVPALDAPMVTARVPGKRLKATLHVPTHAPFFADHFPRRAVFPATLLLDAQIRLAVQLSGEARGGALLRPTAVRNVKVRSFVPPGQHLEISAELLEATPTAAQMALAATSNGTRVATARVDLSE